MRQKLFLFAFTALALSLHQNPAAQPKSHPVLPGADMLTPANANADTFPCLPRVTPRLEEPVLCLLKAVLEGQQNP